MFFNINISSKSLNSLDFFLKVFFKLIDSKKLKLNLIHDFKTNLKKKKVFNVLKSPHVNKTAQEQYKTELFSYDIFIFSNQLFKFLIFIKKLNENLFSNINIKYKIYINKKNCNNNKIKQTNPNNFFIHPNKDYLKVFSGKYLKVLSIYGENCFRNRVMIKNI